MEIVTCNDNTARELAFGTGVCAVSDSEGTTHIVWSAEGTSLFLRRCTNGLLSDGFKIGADDLVCEGVTVTSSIVLKRDNGETVIYVGFSNGGISCFTQFGEAVEMFAYCSFPVTSLKRFRIKDQDFLLILHSNGFLVLTYVDQFVTNPETAPVKTFLLAETTDDTTRLFKRLEMTLIGDHISIYVQESSKLSVLRLKQDSVKLRDPSTLDNSTDLLSGILNYAKSLVSLPPPTVRRRKSSPHSIGLHRDVSSFIIVTGTPNDLSSDNSISLIYDVGPDKEFTQLVLSPGSKFLMSVVNDGSVVIHSLIDPSFPVICSMSSGYLAQSSAAWISSEMFSLLNLKNIVEKWKISPNNFSEKVDDNKVGNKIVAIVPKLNHVDGQSTSLVIRSESKNMIKFDFSKLIHPQVCNIPIDDVLVASVLSSFARHNEQQVQDSIAIETMLLSVEIVLIFLRDVKQNLTAEKLRLVNRECELLELYKEVLGMYEEKADDMSIRSDVNSTNSFIIILNLISNYYGQTECRAEFDFHGFFNWMKSMELKRPEIVPELLQTPTPPTRCNFPKTVLAYRDFSQSEEIACNLILSPLVLRRSDPFLVRIVDKLFSSYCDRFMSGTDRNRAVQRWMISRGRQWYLFMIENKNLEKFLKKFSINFENNYFFDTLILLAILGEKLVFHKFLNLSPLMLRFSSAPPEILSGPNWRFLVALTIANNRSLKKNICDKLVTSDNVASHFGQFGISSDIVDSLLEVVNNENDLSEDFLVFDSDTDLISIEKFTLLILLFKIDQSSALPIDVENLLYAFNEHVDSSDKRVIGYQIVSKLFSPKLIGEWIDAVAKIADRTNDSFDVSAIDTCIGICRTILRPATAEATTDDHNQIFVPLSKTRIECVKRIQYLLEILRVSLKCSIPNCPIRRLFSFEKSPFCSPFVPSSVHREEIISFLANLALTSKRGSKLIHSVSVDLGMQPEVYEKILSQLLNQCFDRDIEEFVHGISSSIFSSLVHRTVGERISVCVRMLAEDTSRLHGIMCTILSHDEMATYLNITVNEVSEPLIREWILVDGPRDVLTSCTRLLNHPKMVAANLNENKFDHAGVARRLIRAINEI